MQALVDYLNANNMFRMATKKPMRLRPVENILQKGDMPALSYHVYKGAKKMQVVTEINGDKETVNVAQCGDVIVCGVKGEMYVVRGKKFGDLYEIEEGGKGIAVAKPQPRCVAHVTAEVMQAAGVDAKGKELVFVAPWGEEMILRAGDVLVREGEGVGYYRVEGGAFAETYDM